MQIRNEFRFTLPKGTDIKTEAGRKVSGTMRLVKVSDIVMIERDSTVQKFRSILYCPLKQGNNLSWRRTRHKS